MKQDIKQLRDKYKDNKEITKFSDLYYSNFAYSEPIKSKDEINRMTMGLEATLSYYYDQDCLTENDIEVMERRIAEYEMAVAKLLSEGENYNYNAEELQILVDKISEYYKNIEDIHEIEKTEKSKIGYNF